MFVFWFFKEATAEGPKLIFTQNTSKDAVPRKDVPFGGFENKNIIYSPPFLRKTAIFGTDFAGTWKIFGRKPLNKWGRSRVNRP